MLSELKSEVLGKASKLLNENNRIKSQNKARELRVSQSE